MSLNITTGIARAAGIIGALQGLLPIIGQVVDAAEGLFPNAGAGASKLAWAQNFINGVLTKAGHAVADVEALSPLVTGLINSVVAAAKTPAPMPTPAATPAP
ncbi:MAG TPA: hypothetical protein VFD98_09440 [Terracidiphilus sp.]|jgi:hypothetical protein|nr:hypothetical protein [Terracidiphilus sp.]